SGRGCGAPCVDRDPPVSLGRVYSTTHFGMNRNTGAAQSRRRNRQGPLEGGRSRARSAVPVVVLGTCMVAVLYGNVSYYSDSLHDHRSSAGPTEGSAPVAQNLQVQRDPLRDTSAEGEGGDDPGDAADVP
ncbi:unnamed protein product, partial [Ectocarpus sp. 12 AP-2014]